MRTHRKFRLSGGVQTPWWPKTRESRLFKSIPSFVQNSLGTMVRMYAMYQPLRAFFYIGSILTILGLLPVLRFLYYYALGEGGGHLQSLILGGVLLMMGFIAFLVGLLADLIGFNRQLLEMTLERVRRMELPKHAPDQVTNSGNDGGKAQFEVTPQNSCGTTDAAGRTSPEL